MTVMYPTDSVVVAPFPYVRGLDNVSQKNAGAGSNALDRGEYRIPNIEELFSIYINKDVFDTDAILITTWHTWSSNSATLAKVFHFSTVRYYIHNSEREYNVICVKR